MRSKENKWGGIYINKDIYQNIFYYDHFISAQTHWWFCRPLIPVGQV